MTFVNKRESGFVSLLISVKNGEKYLAETLESVFSQSYKNFEVIAVDHASTDSTQAILAEFGNRFSSMRIFRFEGESFIDCLNFGLSKCDGGLIARIDSDDIADARRFELQVKFLERNLDVGIVGTAVEKFAEGGVMDGYKRYEKWINSLLTPEDIKREMFVESPIPNPTAMMRREVVEKLGGYKDFGWPEDYDFYLRAMLAGIKMAKLKEPLLKWRDHPERLTRNSERYSEKNFLKVRAFYLSKLLNGNKVVIQGAGTTGRMFGKLLLEFGVEIEAFLDINRLKIGGTKLGKPVYSMEDMQRFKGLVLLSAVSSWGARELIRQEALKNGFVEGVDFFCCS